MFLTLSENLIYQIQVVRHQNQIEKISKAEILEFSLCEWNSFSDLQEIKFQNNFYDVISFKKINIKVVVKVVKDDFENEIRVSFLKILNKFKFPLSDKKKSNSFSKHLLSKNEFICSIKVNIYNSNHKNFDRTLSSKTSSFINFQEKPPC